MLRVNSYLYDVPITCTYHNCKHGQVTLRVLFHLAVKYVYCHSVLRQGFYVFVFLPTLHVLRRYCMYHSCVYTSLSISCFSPHLGVTVTTASTMSQAANSNSLVAGLTGLQSGLQQGLQSNLQSNTGVCPSLFCLSVCPFVCLSVCMFVHRSECQVSCYGLVYVTIVICVSV